MPTQSALRRAELAQFGQRQPELQAQVGTRSEPMESRLTAVRHGSGTELTESRCSSRQLCKGKACRDRRIHAMDRKGFFDFQ